MSTLTNLQTAVRVIASGPLLDQDQAISLERQLSTRASELASRLGEKAPAVERGDVLASIRGLESYCASAEARLAAPKAEPVASVLASAATSSAPASNARPSDGPLTRLEEQAATATEKLQLAAGMTTNSAVRANIEARAYSSLGATAKVLRANGVSSMAALRAKKSMQGASQD
jgi:hypothetical protein